MRPVLFVLSALTIGLLGFLLLGGANGGFQNNAAALEADGGHGRPEPPMLGVHYAHGQGPAKPGGARPAPLLTYHGGDVLTAATAPAVTALYWGSSWTSASDKVTGLATFYRGAAGTNYLGTNTEYTNGSGVRVTSSVTYAGNMIDPNAAPRSAPSTSAVLAEVARLVAHPTPNGYYPVYSDQPRGNAGYCAWHSWGTINGVSVEFAFFFNLDGDAGCDPGDNSSGHSQGLAALGNVSGHELSETLTDPDGSAWFDNRGAENADKCAWTFGSKLVDLGGTKWKIQGNWSNAAYASNDGYTRGCIDGN